MVSGCVLACLSVCLFGGIYSDPEIVGFEYMFLHSTFCSFLDIFCCSISGTDASTTDMTKAGAASDSNSASAGNVNMNANNNNRNVRFRNKEDLLRDLTSSPGTSSSSGGHNNNISSSTGRPPVGKSVGKGSSGGSASRTSRPLFEVRKCLC